MTLTQFGVALATFAALGAAIRAGPAVWSFIRNVARLPSMTESIWREFGRSGDGTLTTRDRIEQIARKVDEAKALAQRSVETAERTEAAFIIHTRADAASFSMVADRFTSLEREVVAARTQEGQNAASAAAATANNGQQRREEHEQTNG